MVLLMFKNKTRKPLIQFVSNIPGLDEIEECKPKPTNKYIPQW